MPLIVVAALVLGGGASALVLVPVVSKVRDTARRTVDQSHLRMIVQASLIAGTELDGVLPPAHLSPDGSRGFEPASIHAVAAMLARDGGLDDSAAWRSLADPHGALPLAEENRTFPVLSSDRRTLHPEFAALDVIAWDYAVGLRLDLPTSTPVAWTRGLRTDGRWDPAAGVYGGRGGFVAFLSGNVQYFESLEHMPLVSPDGSATTNILEALPEFAGVVGSGPGTLHGTMGLAPWPD